MLQQEHASDYRDRHRRAAYTVRDFVTLAAACLDIHLVWKGTGIEEQAFDQKGNALVAVDPRYFPSGRGGNACWVTPAKARRELGWSPRTDFRTLVEEMAVEDMKAAERDASGNPVTAMQCLQLSRILKSKGAVEQRAERQILFTLRDTVGWWAPRSAAI